MFMCRQEMQRRINIPSLPLGLPRLNLPHQLIQRHDHGLDGQAKVHHGHLGREALLDVPEPAPEEGVVAVRVALLQGVQVVAVRGDEQAAFMLGEVFEEDLLDGVVEGVQEVVEVAVLEDPGGGGGVDGWVDAEGCGGFGDVVFWVWF